MRVVTSPTVAGLVKAVRSKTSDQGFAVCIRCALLARTRSTSAPTPPLASGPPASDDEPAGMSPVAAADVSNSSCTGSDSVRSDPAGVAAGRASLGGLLALIGFAPLVLRARSRGRRDAH